MAALLDTSIANCAPLALTLALLLALAATILVLFVGEVLGDMPCALCWYQLIAMFPLVVILGVAALRTDIAARLKAAPPALASPDPVSLVRLQEAALRAAIGPDYDQYAASVPRWIGINRKASR